MASVDDTSAELQESTSTATAWERLQIAEQRDAIARLRDLSATARDEAADARDLAMAELDAEFEQQENRRVLTDAELVARAAEQRRRAVRLRSRAASQRLLAAEDRRAAARDREVAARERQQALRDFAAVAAELDRAAVDELTSARARAAGLRELDNELDRARRTDSLVAIAYVDVVGLKVVNDTLGHSAGDALLKLVVASIKVHMRPYDLVIRVGGDEFLCAMSNLSMEAARDRFDAVAATIKESSEFGGIRVGFAELRHPGETADDLIARADGELIRESRDRGAREVPVIASDSPRTELRAHYRPVTSAGSQPGDREEF